MLLLTVQCSIGGIVEVPTTDSSRCWGLVSFPARWRGEDGRRISAQALPNAFESSNYRLGHINIFYECLSVL